MSNLTCEEYSEKAIVVRGESTKTFKEELKQLGGKYNERLKGGAGWIFSKKSEQKVKEFIEQPKQTKPTTKPTKPTQSEHKTNSNYSSILEHIRSHFSNTDTECKLQFLADVSAILSQKPNIQIVLEEEESEEEEAPRKRLL